MSLTERQANMVEILELERSVSYERMQELCFGLNYAHDPHAALSGQIYDIRRATGMKIYTILGYGYTLDPAHDRKT